MRTTLLLAVPLLLALSGCQTGVTMWEPCTPAADGNPTGTDGTWVLVCEGGTWIPKMTVTEFVEITRGNDVVKTPLPFPPDSDDLVHGGQKWVAVLAASTNPDAPVIGTAVSTAASAGYTTSWTDCDVGASSAVGMPESGVYTVSVYFASEALARAATDAFISRQIPAVAARVQTFCLD